jgi:hypothetical protein
VPEVLKRFREILRMAATQLKLAAGGEASSVFDPLNVQKSTVVEMRVRGRRDPEHLCRDADFTGPVTRNSLEAGVKSIEHANLRTEHLAQIVKNKGAFPSPISSLAASISRAFHATSRPRASVAGASSLC